MRLQEEVEQRTVTLIVNTAKLTERELQKAISKMLIQMKADLARLGNLFKLCIDQHDINSEQFKDTVNNLKKISSNISLFLEKKLK